MTDKELNKLKSSLPEWDKQNEEDQKLDEELDCREMINSILIYGDLNKTIDEIYENKYLRNHKKVLSEERIKELIKEQQDDLRKSKINRDVYTDGEGVTYSSVTWYDEEDQENKKEESKDINQFDKYVKELERKFNRKLNSEEIRLIKNVAPIIEQDKNTKKEESFKVNQKYKDMFIDYCKDKIIDVPEIIRCDNPDYDENEDEEGKYLEFKTDEHDIYMYDEDVYTIIDDELEYIVKDEKLIRENYVLDTFAERIARLDFIGISKHTYDTTLKLWVETDSVTEELNNAFEERYGKVEESKELRKYNSRLYGVYDTEITGTPFNSIFNSYDLNNEDSPIFNQEVIDKSIQGLNEDLNCSAWIVDTMQKESKELRKYNSRLYGVYDTEKQEYIDTGALEDMKKEVATEKEDIEDKKEELKEDKKDININITVKNESVELSNEWKEKLGNNVHELPEYEFRALRYAEINGITDYDIDGNKMIWLEKLPYEGIYEHTLNLDTMRENVRQIKNGKFVESLDKRIELLSKVFAQYPDITEEDEDYLNGLSLEELITELKTRGWEDILEENKEIKTESYEEESIKPIINPGDRYYYDDHLWAVYLYPGAGVELIPYYVYADYEQEALNILLPYLLENAPGLVYDISDLEDDDLSDYVSIDGNYYLDYNTRMEELEGEDKEKIETEFFKNYKEEE